MMPRKWFVIVAVLCTSALLIYLLVDTHIIRIQEYVTPLQQSRISLPNCSPIISTRPRIPSKETISQMTDVDVEELYYRYVENMDVLCVNKVRMGRSRDGGWDVCDDPGYRPQAPCLVYSFGIANDFTFDDAVSSKYGCEVHSFDPSMKKQDHKHSERVLFHNVGLSNEDKVDSNGWTMKTLSSIKTQLNHTKISILKMDIEHHEHQALPQIIASGHLRDVDQLLFEIHMNFGSRKAAKDTMVQGLEIFRDLRDLGFLVFYSHRNDACTVNSPITGRSRTLCNELFMLKGSQKT